MRPFLFVHLKVGDAATDLELIHCNAKLCEYIGWEMGKSQSHRHYRCLAICILQGQVKAGATGAFKGHTSQSSTCCLRLSTIALELKGNTPLCVSRFGGHTWKHIVRPKTSAFLYHFDAYLEPYPQALMTGYEGRALL